MKRLFIRIFIFLCLLVSTKAYAQTDISMTTHWYNRANYNPASIARTEYIYLFANARRQWEGVAEAPEVLNVQASGYIHKYHSAIGISLVSDQIGISKALNPMLTYAYRLAREDSWSLSMGLSAGVFSRSVDGSLYEAVTENDPALYYDLEKTLKPDANFGVEFQSSYFIAGISSTHLFSIKKDSTLFLNANHRYGYAIYKNNDSELINYSLGLQLVNNDNLTVLEGNASVRLKRPTGLLPGPKELFDIGLTYRTSRNLTFLFAVNISSDFRVGYAYDRTFNVGYNSQPSHEIMLEYRIPSKAASTCLQCKNADEWYR